ncbi:hypothetical protein GLOIN_2v1482135 [Rhizophagus clarus]|uniref:Uncharacterized protein n=1 Tax=Rhizophagus clarus TaxID=94130 RepID=A0A8H3KTS2_9GLOM|nr:hypothetical protein GLOIN_2v1482135 [Rhizophagus clarus]
MGISNSNNNVPLKKFEFYLPLSNDAIYRVTYTQLNSFEIAKLLNKGVDTSHIPDPDFLYHINVQSLICQQIRQRVQQHFYQPQQQSQTNNSIPNSIPNSQMDTIAPNSQVHVNYTYNEDMSENTGFNYTTNYASS